MSIANSEAVPMKLPSTIGASSNVDSIRFEVSYMAAFHSSLAQQKERRREDKSKFPNTLLFGMKVV